jgi:hypothetical protein
LIKNLKNINDFEFISELKELPNQGVLWEIIENNKTGKVFELPGNAFLIMENCNDPFVFIIGNLTNEAVNVAITLLNDREFPMVYCNPRYHPLFLRSGWNFHLRAELQLNKLTQLQTLDNTLNIKPITTIDLFEKCFWYKERSELYVSDTNFLKSGQGYALCIGDDVISEAYASIGGGYAEISVITHPDYRGKGYASQIVFHLIQNALMSKQIPIWSCNIDN